MKTEKKREEGEGEKGEGRGGFNSEERRSEYIRLREEGIT